tara:strand:- start:70 stop:972 length:903 start_codon:yes stop_codon:yes gene_type:complete
MYEDALVVFSQALIFNPENTAICQDLGNISQILGDYENAASYYGMIDSPSTEAMSMECLYKAGKIDQFFEKLDAYSNQTKVNIRIAALSSFAAHQLKRDDPYPFCRSPLDFLQINHLSVFSANWKEIIDNVLSEANDYKLVWESRTTKFGYQTANDIFEEASGSVLNLQSLIQKAIESYRSDYSSKPDAFIQSWPERGKLAGWFNRLLKNGYQDAHIHAAGWLSGVIYLQTLDIEENSEGAIEFGLHGYGLPISDENYPRLLHNPKKGDIVLFPSSLFHRTIPFTKDIERCVIAFDLEPI